MPRYSEKHTIGPLQQRLWREMCKRHGEAVSFDDLVSAVYGENEPEYVETCIGHAMNQLVINLIHCGWNVRLRVMRGRGANGRRYQIVDVADTDAPCVIGATEGAGLRKHHFLHRVPSPYGSVHLRANGRNP